MKAFHQLAPGTFGANSAGRYGCLRRKYHRRPNYVGAPPDTEARLHAVAETAGQRNPGSAHAYSETGLCARLAAAGCHDRPRNDRQAAAPVKFVEVQAAIA